MKWKESEIKFLKALSTSPYRDRKERNPDRVLGTCEWFVSHNRFREWKESKDSKLLWVSADPGCGKSVLAKYLVDTIIPTTETRTVCYFFFKDDFDDQKNIVSAISCLLRQIFEQNRTLLSDAILEQFEIDGKVFTSSFNELWQTLINIANNKVAGEIVCLLDALDECEDQGRALLVQKLCQLYGRERTSTLKFIITSRPYGEIRRGFQPLDIPSLPMIHLSGESDVETEKIAREIDIFIRARVQDIGARLRLSQKEEDTLLQELLRIPNRTYLWVHLTLDLIENDVNINQTEILKATSRLPRTVNEAYDRTLSRSRDLKSARKILHLIVAAARPLNLKEMALALELEESRPSWNDRTLLTEERFRENLRDACGLFVTVIDSKIYLLHQTAREFLLRKDEPEDTKHDLKWKHSIKLQDCHRILARICIQYLLVDKPDIKSSTGSNTVPQHVAAHVLLDYSAKHWAEHFRELSIEEQTAMTQGILRLCDTSSTTCLSWLNIYWATDQELPKGFTQLMATSYFGLSSAVKSLLDTKGIAVTAVDKTYNRSALSWAAGNGWDTVVKLLMKHSIFGRRYLNLRFGHAPGINAKDIFGRTALIYAVWDGNLAIVNRLIKAGARIDAKDQIEGTALSYAVCHAHEKIVEILLEKGTSNLSRDEMMNRLLWSAAEKGHKDVISSLLNTGQVNLNARNQSGDTALLIAAKYGHSAVIRLLLETG
ncbi:ankyrin repeat-containing domain protein, partial [Phaeosphaeriaceae sp. PMI808]